MKTVLNFEGEKHELTTETKEAETMLTRSQKSLQGEDLLKLVSETLQLVMDSRLSVSLSDNIVNKLAKPELRKHLNN